MSTVNNIYLWSYKEFSDEGNPIIDGRSKRGGQSRDLCCDMGDQFIFHTYTHCVEPVVLHLAELCKCMRMYTTHLRHDAGLPYSNNLEDEVEGHARSYITTMQLTTSEKEGEQPADTEATDLQAWGNCRAPALNYRGSDEEQPEKNETQVEINGFSKGREQKLHNRSFKEKSGVKDVGNMVVKSLKSKVGY
ncbi:hypothetical protein F5146DRAFT_1117737 [Armillaria mellea]|nr:hypothetical protein F5146DRAFT_1117737 [Armillaria mellea]